MKVLVIVWTLLVMVVLNPSTAFCLENTDKDPYVPAKTVEDGQNKQEKILIGQSKSSPGSNGSTKVKQPDLSPITLLKSGLKSFWRAQDFGPMISTDRNSVTPHPNAVPLGYLQVENGSTMNLSHRGGNIIFPETVVRLGTWIDGEMRFQVPNFVTSSGTLGDFRGFSDIQVSVKQDVEHTFLNKKGIDIGIIGGINLPTGSSILTAKRVDPFFQSIFFYRRKNYTIGTSHSLFLPSELPDDDVLIDGIDRKAAYQPTVILFKHLKTGKGKYRDERADIWIEYAGLFANGIKSVQVMDFGAVWRPLRRHQIDFRYGVGISRNAPRTFLGFGYSWLPGKVIPFYKRAPEHTYRP